MKYLTLTVCLLALTARRADAIFIDLRNLTAANFATAEGATVSMSANGTLRSTSTRYGVDRTSTADAPDLVDGGSGVAEQVSFIFGAPVYVDSIVISEFGPSDAGTFTFKGESPYALSNGVVGLGGTEASSSLHTLSWTGANVSGADRGFSIDGFNVRPVTPFDADFDGDDDVDGTDFLIWQRGLRSGVNIPQNTGNANYDGAVNRVDLDVWKLQFGNAALVVGVVPEPSSLFLAGGVALSVGGRLRRRQMCVRPRYLN